MAMMPRMMVEVRCRSDADVDGDSVRAECEWLQCPS
jgi:hypothetical protein